MDQEVSAMGPEARRAAFEEWLASGHEAAYVRQMISALEGQGKVGALLLGHFPGMASVFDCASHDEVKGVYDQVLYSDEDKDRHRRLSAPLRAYAAFLEGQAGDGLASPNGGDEVSEGASAMGPEARRAAFEEWFAPGHEAAYVRQTVSALEGRGEVGALVLRFFPGMASVFECASHDEVEGAYDQVLGSDEDKDRHHRLSAPLRAYAGFLKEQVGDGLASSDQDWDAETAVTQETGDCSEDAVQYPKNLILFGPPGTGKTYRTRAYAVAICIGEKVDDVFGKMNESEKGYYEIANQYKKLKDEGRIGFTTFHQSYGYEEFIEGLRPEYDDEKGVVTYPLRKGVFREFCDKADAAGQADGSQPKQVCDKPDAAEQADESGAGQDCDKPFVFIIDEINRGNVSKIFGELITLLEPSKRKGEREEITATLPYSGEQLSVPSNVYVIGTMNTADRSIALLDTALRRRFDFVEVMPDPDAIQGTIEGSEIDIKEMLRAMNRRIELLYDREHMLGHAFFMELGKNSPIDRLADIFDNRIIPLLQEYFFDDYAKIRSVLGAAADDFIEVIDAEGVFFAEDDAPRDGLRSYRVKPAPKEFKCYKKIYMSDQSDESNQGDKNIQGGQD